jgi:hypothetical protein
MRKSHTIVILWAVRTSSIFILEIPMNLFSVSREQEASPLPSGNLGGDTYHQVKR